MNDQKNKNDVLIPSEYARLFDTDWREAAIYGGRCSLKSGTVARILLIRASNKRGRCGCFREYQNSITDSSYSLLKDVIEDCHLPNFRITNDSIINTKTGYDFIFRGLHNNIQSVKSIEGMTEAWVEEAQTITESSLEILTPTVRKEGSQLFYTYNRLTEKDAIHKRLVIDGRPHTLLLNLNYDVALKYGWMSRSLIDEMESDRENRPQIFKHKWLGEPASKSGKVYTNWEKIETVPKEAQYLGNGLDFGYTNDPTSIINIYKWNNSYIVDEICYQRKLSNSSIAELLQLNIDKLGDELTVGDSAEPKSIQEISDHGISIIPCVKGKDSINNGIQRLQGVKIYYTANSHNIEEEYYNYAWKFDREDKALNVPIDAYNHAMDAIRYFITYKEGYKPVEYWGIR